MAPSPGQRAFIKDLELRKVFVVHPGERSYDLDETIRAVGTKQLSEITEWLE